MAFSAAAARAAARALRLVLARGTSVRARFTSCRRPALVVERDKEKEGDRGRGRERERERKERMERMEGEGEKRERGERWRR
jgi:hypothetical protein